MEWLSFLICSAVAFVELIIAYCNPQQMVLAVSFAIFFLLIGLGLSVLLYLRKIKHLLEKTPLQDSAKHGILKETEKRR